jgi:ATP-binding protein involved in chromosome partitioning
MKIAMPIAEGKLAAHFGHCAQFALVEIDASTNTALETHYVEAPAHEPGLLPQWLHEQGADVVITGGMGRCAQKIFAEQGIEVVVGVPAAFPEEIVSAYLGGSLETGENLCDH